MQAEKEVSASQVTKDHCRLHHRLQQLCQKSSLMETIFSLPIQVALWGILHESGGSSISDRLIKEGHT